MTTKQAGPIDKLAGLWAHHPLYLHIATLFTLLVLVTGAAIAWSNYVQGRNIALTGAEAVFERMERESLLQIEGLRTPAETVVDWMSSAPITEAANVDTRMQTLRAMARVIDKQLPLAAIYIGYANGDFFLLRALRDDADRAPFKASPQARYLLQHIEGAGAARFVTLDTQLKPLSDTAAADFSFDARTRPWYVDAVKSTGLVHTAPYVFFTTGRIGVTIARRAENGRAVVGVDLRLTPISQSLAKARMTASSQLAIFSNLGDVIGYSHSRDVSAAGAEASATIAKIADLPPALATAAAQPERHAASRMIDVDGRVWLVKVAPLAREANADRLVVAVPRDELFTEAEEQLRRGAWITLLVILLAVPLTWLISRRIAANLRELTDEAACIRRFDFSSNFEVRTRINEIHGLGKAMAQMKETLRKFLDISTALAGERQFDRLLSRVMQEAIEAAGGQGAVVYLCEHENGKLRPAAQHWQSGVTLELAELAVAGAANPVSETLSHPVAPRLHMLSPQRPPGLQFVDDCFGNTPVQLASVPLPNRAGEIIGVLCIFSAGDAEPPSQERMALVEAFSGAGAVAIDNQRLLLAQKALLESLIGLVARAIDAKSPYTYGHCQRVPALTHMLARAACDAKEGPFAQFNLNNDQWEALHIAAWLHDCGKVTTPEYVVDKATKLETIYDRIHVVRMRFEVLKRDAEIECLKKIAAGAEPVSAHAEKEAQWRVLNEEFAFIASCNAGGEFMAPEKIDRLKAIAARTWQRTLDDRLGVSWEEAERMARLPAQPLPVTEPLLADKPEHIITRREQERIPEDNRWGFKLKEPESKYNRGELYNLAISRGTLTEEERYVINDHIAQTIIMLSELPFPPHLKDVPELAGGHHEKMDGTGYPKRLARDAMSVQARVMAIADIFEALTAADRPYKKGKKLSEAVRIMGFMKKDQHIDPDLFDLFLKSGVYLQFAQAYLAPEYIDEVDIRAYVGETTAP